MFFIKQNFIFPHSVTLILMSIIRINSILIKVLWLKAILIYEPISFDNFYLKDQFLYRIYFLPHQSLHRIYSKYMFFIESNRYS